MCLIMIFSQSCIVLGKNLEPPAICGTGPLGNPSLRGILRLARCYYIGGITYFTSYLFPRQVQREFLLVVVVGTFFISAYTLLVRNHVPFPQHTVLYSTYAAPGHA